MARLRFAVACWSVFDPLARYRMVRARQVKHLLDAHAAYWKDEAEMAEGNPQLILERREFSDLPPLLVIQGTRDDNLTDDMADRFVAAYHGGGRRGHAAQVRRHAARVHQPRAGRRRLDRVARPHRELHHAHNGCAPPLTARPSKVGCRNRSTSYSLKRLTENKAAH